MLLTNGNVLFAHQFAITEITADKKVVWNYDAPANTEIHTAQPFSAESVWFVQNGDPAKFMVVNKTSGKTERGFILPVKNPKGVHGQFRQARLTKAGTLLVAHMDLGKAVEYDLEGKALWSAEVPGIWSAKALPNGNVLATSNRGFVREISRQGNAVWEWTRADAPDYTSPYNGSRIWDYDLKVTMGLVAHFFVVPARYDCVFTARRSRRAIYLMRYTPCPFGLSKTILQRRAFSAAWFCVGPPAPAIALPAGRVRFKPTVPATRLPGRWLRALAFRQSRPQLQPARSLRSALG